MLIVGIAGGTGCGKTTVVEQITSALPKNKVVVISQDSYYHDLSHLSKKERSTVNFDHPDAIDFDLLIEQLGQLRKGETIQMPVYSFVEETRLAKTITVAPKQILLVEGILVLNNKKLRALFDIKLFIDADADVRLIRRLKRDMQERGHNLEKVLKRYLSAAKPMHKQFVEPSKEYADFIIPNNDYNDSAATRIQTLINEKTEAK